MYQDTNRDNKHSFGFTLIELMLSIAIVSLLAGLSLPVYASFNNRNDLDLATQNVASTLRRAETYSRGAKADNSWGVERQSGKVTLFKGTSFVGRDTTFDESTTIPPSVALSGLNEVLFSKLSGLPTTTGNIILTLTTGGSETRTVNINAKGVINY
ncbi:MAG TPA: type II secretion system protein [Candidatus Saccharimonadales bacterium]|nr:type II secretion system protein [Candidatus Saccharimonadales bacterium]